MSERSIGLGTFGFIFSPATLPTALVSEDLDHLLIKTTSESRGKARDM